MNITRIIGHRLFDAIAKRVIRRALRTPYSHLRHADGRPYMDRYWLFRVGKSGPDGRYPLIGARVHHIQSSDDDRAFHDHPWPFITIILRGGYAETRPCPYPVSSPLMMRIGGEVRDVTMRRFQAGDVLFRRARDWHILHVRARESATTLFITFPMVQRWGFLWNGLKVDYLAFEAEHASSGIHVTHVPGGNLAPDSP